MINFRNWDQDQLIAIHSIFVVLKTVKDYYNGEENFLHGQDASLISLGAWWAPIGFWGICTVVGVLTVGVAGIACAGLVAVSGAYINYQNQP